MRRFAAKAGEGTWGWLSHRLLLRMLVVVALLEVLVMGIMDLIPPVHGFWLMALDALLLTFVSAPFLYLAVIRPVGVLWTEAVQTRADLAREREIREEREEAETVRLELEAQLRQSQKMEAIGSLAGGMAHDLNNLLTPIIGWSNLLLTKWDKDGEQRAEVAEIRAAAERATDLVRQLLAFARREPMQPRVLDPNEIVRGMHGLLARLLGESISLATILDPQLLAVKMDPSRLEQVIMNLAVNARDAMPRGGRLTIETGNRGLDEAYAGRHPSTRPGPHVMIAVSDTGRGMDQDTQSGIFEPFFTTKEVGKGTGLGLSTVYGIVKQSGGDVWVYSELEKGTTFKIYLPGVAERPVPVSVAPVEKQSRELTGEETVLVVEDEEAVRALVTRVLRLNGYAVLEAASADQALAFTRSEPQVDLVLADVVLPGMGGPELVQIIKRVRPQAAVLYMSGYTRDSIIHGGHANGDIELLEKPFTPDSLARRVREVLDKREARLRPEPLMKGSSRPIDGRPCMTLQGGGSLHLLVPERHRHPEHPEVDAHEEQEEPVQGAETDLPTHSPL
ncbi:MAG: ATP-binding protein [Thermoleophilia bacterium]|nr:ATP-binding protein [Thermoleophilia bacterium]